jgi:hypothetical protein
MKRFLLIPLLAITSFLKAQQIENIYFHLYTDSLKLGRHNYINVDGKLSNGQYVPLTDKEVIFKSNTGTWQGNDLILDSSYRFDSVSIKATLKNNNAISKSIVIYIKKSSYEGKLASEDDILIDQPKKKKGPN